jgi:hypothetical protein
MNNLPEDWKDIVLNTMREGGTERKAIVALGITRKQHNEISDEEYKEVFAEGTHLRMAYLEDLYMKAVSGESKVNPTLIIFMMKQIGWSDRTAGEQDRTSKLFKKHKEKDTIQQFKVKEKKDGKKNSRSVSIN